MYEHFPEDVRQMLEERKKKRDEEDLQVALASIKVDRAAKLLRSRRLTLLLST